MSRTQQPAEGAQQGALKLRDGAAVAAAAILAYSWAAGLAFQIDDYWIIPSSGTQLRTLAELVTKPAELFRGDGMPLPEPEVPLFQPVLWAQFALERRLAGEPVDAALFHLGSVLLHAATAVALLAWLGRRFGRRAALPGALLFAIHPGAAQAVTWVSARGLVLVLLFGILASLAEERGHRTGRRRWEWLAGALLGLALWSHSSAAAVVVLALVLALLRRRRSGSRTLLLATAALLVPAAVAAVVRRGYLGPAAATYIGGISVGFEAVPRMLRALPALARQVLAPWNRDAAVADVSPLLAAAGGPATWAVAGWTLAILPALVRDAGARRRLGAAFAAFALLGAPALFLGSLYLGAHDFRSSRALYPALAAVAAALAAAVAADPGAGPWRRIRAAGLVLLALVALDGLVHTARVERRAAGLVRARAEGIAAAAEEVGAGGLVQVLDPHVTFAGVPLVSPKHVPKTVRPPFRSPALAARTSNDLGALLFEGALTAWPGRLRILAWEETRYVALGGVLPPIPETLPPLAASDSDLPDSACFRPAFEAPPRAAAAIRVPLAPGAARTVYVLVRNERTQILHEVQAGEGAAEAWAGLDEQQDWLLADRIEAVYVRGAGMGAGPPELRRSLPEADARTEPAGDGPMPIGATPEFLVPGAGPSDALRILLSARVGDAVFRTVYLAPPEAIDRSAGVARYRPRPEDVVYATHESLRFDRIRGYFEEILALYGLRRLTIDWRLSIHHPGRKTERARSPWKTLVLESR